MSKVFKVYMSLFIASIIFAVSLMTIPDIQLERRREERSFELGYARNIERLAESTNKFTAYSDAKAAYVFLENSNIKNVAEKDPEVKDWLERNKAFCDRLYLWCIEDYKYVGTVNEGVREFLYDFDIVNYAYENDRYEPMIKVPKNIMYKLL